ncbi:MAG: hypothetical protein BRD29_01400 [Bacteroidetes bacterium QH_2_67_10]|nr:MAG: hypothetical protein BRD29_01400 [Bacteroidetes bacterium QH_2_67_10]
MPLRELSEQVRLSRQTIVHWIDRKKIKKLIRAGDVQDVEVDDETKIVVGSIEDFMIEREQSRRENGEAEEEEEEEE